jgi:hypothetical protein
MEGVVKRLLFIVGALLLSANWASGGDLAGYKLLIKVQSCTAGGCSSGGGIVTVEKDGVSGKLGRFRFGIPVRDNHWTTTITSRGNSIRWDNTSGEDGSHEGYSVTVIGDSCSGRYMRRNGERGVTYSVYCRVITNPSWSRAGQESWTNKVGGAIRNGARKMLPKPTGLPPKSAALGNRG